MAFNKINVTRLQKIQEKIIPNQPIHYMKIILDAGCWLPVTGYWFPDAGRLMQDTTNVAARFLLAASSINYPASSISLLLL
jgi:hypothetical protein